MEDYLLDEDLDQLITEFDGLNTPEKEKKDPGIKTKSPETPSEKKKIKCKTLYLGGSEFSKGCVENATDKK